MSKPTLTQIENALMALVTGDATISGYIKSVDSLSARSFDPRDSRLIANPPAILFHFEEGPLASTNIADTSYDYTPSFAILVHQRNLRSDEDARKGGSAGEVGIYQMLDDLKNAVGGKIITLGSTTGQVRLLGQKIEQFGADGLWYSLTVEVKTNWH